MALENQTDKTDLTGQLLDRPQSPRTQALLRLEEDGVLLRRMFEKVSGTRTVDYALNWGEKHGISFLVDRTCVNVGGYYMTGTGAVAFPHDYLMALTDPYNSRWMMTDGAMAGIVTHELRHAWQDYYGLIATRGKTFTDIFIRQALIEADAHAHEKLTGQEVYLRNSARRMPEMAKEIAQMGKDLKGGRDLERHFRDWYETWSGKTLFYGDATIREVARAYGVPGITMAVRRYEHPAWPVLLDGIDVTHVDDIRRRLGRDFTGGNYLNRISNDDFLKKFLNPSLAATFFGAANPKEFKMVDEVRKRALLLGMHGKMHKKQPGNF